MHDLLGPGLRLELAAVDVRRLRELAIAFNKAEDAFGPAGDGLGRGLRIGERIVALGRGRHQLRARPREGRDRSQRVHDLVRKNAHQVRLGGHFERSELALHRKDGEHRHRLIQTRDLRGREDRFLRNAVEDQPGDLARPRRKPDRGGQLRT